MAHWRDLGVRRGCANPTHPTGECGGTWWDCDHSPVNASLTTAWGAPLTTEWGSGAWPGIPGVCDPPAATRDTLLQIETRHTLAAQVREPKGPLGLRLRLAWMRLRLWAMRARLDGRPWREFHRPLTRSAPAAFAGYTIVAVATGTPWWPAYLFLAVASAIASVGAWLLVGGWRTPTLDKALKETPQWTD